ncbi:hypothetical protein PINS_up019166 [Pythium insidiosum]|nr:hypothetical protein PINS_up019166 [Pythium insidiosum]
MKGVEIVGGVAPGDPVVDVLVLEVLLVLVVDPPVVLELEDVEDVVILYTQSGMAAIAVFSIDRAIIPRRNPDAGSDVSAVLSLTLSEPRGPERAEKLSGRVTRRFPTSERSVHPTWSSCVGNVEKLQYSKSSLVTRCQRWGSTSGSEVKLV